jgi:hypothetical protein
LIKLIRIYYPGLANLFHGNELMRLSQQYKTDSDVMRNSIVDSFHPYLNDLGKDISRINSDWNDPRTQEALISALTSSFATLIKRYNLPIKHIGKYDVEKIPMFMQKKSKLKKSSSNSSRGHNFLDNFFISSKSLCHKCSLPFWGIGYQGVSCQKSKCEIKLHRNCLLSGITIDCNFQKTIKTDYKEKFDSIQKILFGPKSDSITNKQN